jgi:hypothetical protein
VNTIANGISIKAHVPGANVSCLPEVASFEHGYRAYSIGPSCVQVQGLDEEGHESMFLDIPEDIARKFAEGILKTLDSPMNKRKAIG